MTPEKLAVELSEVAAEIEKPLVLLDKLGEILVNEARSLVRVRTGYLRDSIHMEIQGIEMWVEASAPYAVFVESKYPFMAPAVINAQAQIDEAVYYFGNDTLQKVSKG